MTHVLSVSKEVEFDLGHRVPGHQSKCRHPHGHRYRVRATCEGALVLDQGAADEGMLVDFGDLKAWLTTYVHDPLDHGFAHARHDPVARGIAAAMPDAKLIEFAYPPTAEILAAWCWEQLEPVVDEHWRGNLRLSRIELWETPTSLAVLEGHR